LPAGDRHLVHFINGVQCLNARTLDLECCLCHSMLDHRRISPLSLAGKGNTTSAHVSNHFLQHGEWAKPGASENIHELKIVRHRGEKTRS
jgi:hypothetical protein